MRASLLTKASAFRMYPSETSSARPLPGHKSSDRVVFLNQGHFGLASAKNRNSSARSYQICPCSLQMRESSSTRLKMKRLMRVRLFIFNERPHHHRFILRPIPANPLPIQHD